MPQTDGDRYAEILRREAGKRLCFIKIRDAAAAVDEKKLGSAVSDSLKRYGSLPDVEYSMLGGSEYGFFYTLVEAFFTALCGAKGSKEKAFALRDKFRSCCSILYSNGAMPDVKALSSWTALATGTLKSPYMFDVMNANRNTPGQGDSMDISNARYPFYMPYLEYTPEQRMLFDEFVYYMAYVQETDAVRDMDGVLRQYGFAAIKDGAKALCGAADMTYVNKKSEIDEMNVRLAQMFDYYSKCIHYMYCDINVKNSEPGVAELFSDERKADGMVCVPDTVATERGIRHRPDLIWSDYAALVRNGLRHISAQEARAYARLGFALKSPLAIKAAGSMNMDEKLRCIDEYCEFKKSMFVSGSAELKIKDTNELARIAFPSYASLLDEEDTAPLYSHDISADRDLPGRDWSRQFDWLTPAYMISRGLFAGTVTTSDRQPSYSAREIKEGLGIPEDPEPYTGPCL